MLSGIPGIVCFRITTQEPVEIYPTIMIVLEQYKRLCAEFLSVAQTYMDKNKLTELKKYYADTIDSRRQLSSVIDLHTLLTLLEKRDVLNYKHIGPLYHIAERYVANSVLQNKLKVYEDWCSSNDNTLHLGNMYLEESDDSSSQEDETSDRIRASNMLYTRGHLAGFSKEEHVYNHHRLSTVQQTIINNKESQLQQRVLLFVSKGIGHSWRDVVRYLNVTEAKIDEIQSQWPNDMKEQCYQALRHWLSTCHNINTWKIDLMQALVSSRRKDLQEEVAKMVI